MAKHKKILLISNSYPFGGGYLAHAKAEIADFLKGVKTILFVPFALADKDDYAKANRDYFKQIGINLNSLHKSNNPKKDVNEAEAIFIGGGNTFRLLKTLYELDVLDPLKKKILKGTPYIGSSAGIHIVTPTIRTTNDMPIVEPPSLDAIGAISFQVNPHYIDADPTSTHMGETREKKIEQFHEDNESTVVGLREGAWLKIENQKIYLGGKKGAKVFIKDKSPREYKSGSYLKVNH